MSLIFTPTKKNDVYSRPSEKIADKIVIGQVHPLLASTNVILNNEDPNNNKSRNRNAF